MKARVHITLRPGVRDPQGEAVAQALAVLGFEGIGAVRQGKVLDIELAEADPDRSRRAVGRMCERLLANTVIEDYEIDIRP